MWSATDFTRFARAISCGLPEPARPVAVYVPYRITGNQVFIAGNIPPNDLDTPTFGKVGRDLTTEDAYIAARSHFEPDLLPYEWYRSLVIAGARYHGFPENYISDLERVDCINDPDLQRRFRYESLLAKIAHYAG